MHQLVIKQDGQHGAHGLYGRILQTVNRVDEDCNCVERLIAPKKLDQISHFDVS